MRLHARMYVWKVKSRVQKKPFCGTIHVWHKKSQSQRVTLCVRTIEPFIFMLRILSLLITHFCNITFTASHSPVAKLVQQFLFLSWVQCAFYPLLGLFTFYFVFDGIEGIKSDSDMNKVGAWCFNLNLCQILQ